MTDIPDNKIQLLQLKIDKVDKDILAVEADIHFSLFKGEIGKLELETKQSIEKRDSLHSERVYLIQQQTCLLQQQTCLMQQQTCPRSVAAAD